MLKSFYLFITRTFSIPGLFHLSENRYLDLAGRNKRALRSLFLSEKLVENSRIQLGEIWPQMLSDWLLIFKIFYLGYLRKLVKNSRIQLGGKNMAQALSDCI